jgi:hypothetical protein
MVGYDKKTKAYMLYDPISKRIILNRDVQFDDKLIRFHHLKLSTVALVDIFLKSLSDNLSGLDDNQPNDQIDQTTTTHGRNDTDIIPPTIELDSKEDLSSSPIPTLSPSNSTEIQTYNLNQTLPVERPEPTHRVSIRQRHPSSRLRDHYLFFTKETSKPQNYTSTMQAPEWATAIKQEVDSINKNQTWTYVNLPSGKWPITSKWIFKEKVGPSGKVEKLKARLVAKGFIQKEGVDFYDTFAPIVRWSTIRIIISLATMKNWHIYQYDVKTAFLNGKITEEVYMHMPKGFRCPENEGQVCKMQRALYGLRQALRAWYARIDSYLRIKLTLTHGCIDSNMYFSITNGRYVILLLYVDDLLLTGDNEKGITKIKTKLMHEYEMTYLGHARLYLGVELTYNGLGTWLHQRRYIESLLIRFGMEQCHTLIVPMTQSTHLQTEMNSPPYDL